MCALVDKEEAQLQKTIDSEMNKTMQMTHDVDDNTCDDDDADRPPLVDGKPLFLQDLRKIDGEQIKDMKIAETKKLQREQRARKKKIVGMILNKGKDMKESSIGRFRDSVSATQEPKCKWRRYVHQLRKSFFY